MIRTAPVGLVGGLVALAALGFLHQELQPVRAVLCGAIALGIAVALRAAWEGLPRFVARWLEGGIAVTVATIAATATAATAGVPYAVLRWQEIAALSAIAGLVGTGTAALGYTHRRLAVEIAQQTERLAALRQEALNSRLAALSAQINPHFLFNALNVLAEIVHEDEDRAEDLVTDLAAMMRYALRSSAARVPLSEEIDVVRRLLRIEEARLGARLRWRVALADEAAAVLVPGLLIQPLVENAVRHGAAPRAEGGRIEVEVVREGDRVRVVVADDGPGLPPEIADDPSGTGRGTAGAGGGLRNVAERARLAWPAGSAGLAVEAVERGTRLVLTFPAEEESK